MSFNIGDKVRIKDVVYDTYGIGEENINKYRGEIYTISIVNKDEDEISYKLKEDNLGFNWLADMLELVEDYKMKNIDIIANDKRLNDIAVCKACYKLKNNMSCTSVPCQECEFFRLKDCYKFLAEEYKPKIKLTKFEYDLLKTNDQPHSRKFNSFATYRNMQEVGYFKNIIDTSMTIKDILENCE